MDFQCSRRITWMSPVSVAEDVPDAGGLGDGHDLVAVHGGLDGPDRVHLGHHHDGAHSPRPGGETAAAPAVAADHHRASGEERRGGADDAVHRRLAGAVAVVEEVLRQRVVHRHHREPQGSLRDSMALRRMDAVCRLFHASQHLPVKLRAVRKDRGDQVGAVVHGDDRLVVERRLEVTVVGVPVLACDREDRYAVVRNQSDGRRIVLRGEGLEAQSTRSAPPAESVRARFAVSVVMWRHADILRPERGFSAANGPGSSAGPACPGPPTRYAACPLCAARDL
jgi:hypothetical protein